MHALHAQVLDISLLKLNAHFQAPDADHADSENVIEEAPQALELTYQLKADLALCNAHHAFKSVCSGPDVALRDNILYLPSVHLSAMQKRQVWALIHES